MNTVGSLGEFLEALAPVSLAEDWDNVGLLVGDELQTVQRVMTCLTITPESAFEAVSERVDLIVTHHPLPFRPLQQLTTASHEGEMLWDLMRAGVSIYSPHTAYDSCQGGINQQLAVGLELQGIRPLIPAGDPPPGTIPPGEGTGGGRYGSLKHPLDLGALAERVKSFLGVGRVQLVCDMQRPQSYVAVACGSAGEFLRPAIDARCNVLVTGEVSFHTCLAARAAGMNLILAGHYASERFAVETLADTIRAKFPELSVWASRQEANPLGWC
jgi:dinuclear metal center YbgI/SA1388 family protein